MKCPNCNTENTEGSKFCIKCGKEIKEIIKTETVQTPAFCSKCGAPLKAGVKFCTKCGTPVQASIQKPASAPEKPHAQQPTGSAANAPVQRPTDNASQAPVQKKEAPSTQATVKQPLNTPAQAPATPGADKKKKDSSFQAFFQSPKGLILILALVIVALIVAILLVLKSFGVFSKSGKDTEKPSTETVSEVDEPEDIPEEDNEDEEALDPQTEKEIENIKNEIKTYVEAGDESEGINGYYPEALDRYIILATDYDYAEEIQEEASEVFDKYAAQTRYSVSLLDTQSVSSGLYVQTRRYYDEILDYAEKLEAAGISVDSEDLVAASDELIEFYRTRYIDAINEITERENWSRDEAWNIAKSAASIVDDDGNMILFDLNDLDDPLRLRYIFCEAMATRKEVEAGVASGNLSAADALDIIDSKLEETDYNPQLIFDAISYCNAGKLDPAPYTVAFNSIMDRLSDHDGIILVLTPDDAEDNKVDINHFWAFNDISNDADSRYQVSTINGTTSETRAWIRDNIRINRIDN